MARLEILCGFNIKDFDKFKKTMAKELLKYGYEASFHILLVKQRIKEYVDSNPECSVVILQEKIDREQFTAEEIAQLTDQRDVNVIVVLSGRRKGKDFMKILYNANITNAIFQEGRKDGASVKELVDLIVQRRSRKDAREYYGIANQRIEFGFLDDDSFVEKHRNLHREGTSILKNYIDCCAKMTPQQIADFTRRLPEEDMDELVKYQEFHVVMQLLKKIGIDLKIKKPRKLQIGLQVPQEITFKGSGNEVYGEKEVVPKTVEEAEEIKMDEKQISGLSIEEMLAVLNGESVVKPDKEEFGEPKLDEENSGEVEFVTVQEEERPLSSDASEAGLMRSDAQVKAEEIPAEKMFKNDMEQILKEERNKVKEEYEARLREERIKSQKELEKQEEKLRMEQMESVIAEQRERELSEKALEREIRLLKKKEEALKNTIKRNSYTEEEDEEVTFLLACSGKQYSWGFVLVLLILVGVAMALLFLKPMFI